MLYRLMRTMRERATDSTVRKTLSAAPGAFEAIAPPLIIGATGGSGTRALSNVLKHAGFTLGNNLNEDNDSLDVAAFLAHWVPQWIEIGNDHLPGARGERMTRHFQAALLRLRSDAMQPETPWIVKNPRLMYLLPFIDRIFPTFRFIHMVRDGRDMAFSKNQGQLVYLGAKYLGEAVTQKNPVQSARLWSLANMAADEFAKTRMAERALTIRYEDLCADPAGTARRIFDFTGLEGDAEAAAREIRTPSSLGRWRQQDPDLVAQVVDAGRGGLLRFGYELET